MVYFVVCQCRYILYVVVFAPENVLDIISNNPARYFELSFKIYNIVVLNIANILYQPQPKNLVILSFHCSTGKSSKISQNKKKFVIKS